MSLAQKPVPKATGKPLTAATTALAVVSFLSFVFGWIFVYFLIVNKTWCFADFCVESMGSRKNPVRNTLAVFYGFLILSALVTLTAKYRPSFKRVLESRPFATSTLTVAEITWFTLAIVISNIVIPGMIWVPYWNMWVSMLSMTGMDMGRGFQDMNWPWIRIVWQTLTLTTGDSLAVLLGFVVLFISKHSFLLSLLDLPYPSTLRIHQWLGYSILVLTCIHLIVTMLAYSLDVTPLYQLFFTVPAGSPWGSSQYLYVLGLASFLFLAVVTFLSLPRIRRLHFNLFYFVHFLIFVSVVFAYLHASMSIFYMIPGLIMYGLDVAVRLYKSIEYHPWSIVAFKDGSASFIVKSTKNPNEWTARVVQVLKSSDATYLSVQGPFGNPIHKFASQSDILVAYVAGSGIAPAIPLISQARDTGDHVPKQTILIWVAAADNMHEFSPIQDLREHGVKIILFNTSPKSSAEPRADTHQGRPYLHSLLTAHVAPAFANEAVKPKVGLFVCGPERFTEDALVAVDRFGADQNSRVAVHVESFEM
ncbi:uncharacterized protein BJ171DRAFT_615436 [Polychytrium aggregatum]|uniref:uncharacterized protein n=1 Tax=Polychytrium aggregatum TaxID=110093 RepID=UPI0022FECA76|nr:uncharacterized protein BJ171DRAFT_615436 [Polychytrium aggregatum]KAI9190692.1 hypothetical protein BJ171DRAFT_615436 [Polychytrium aggregatum]